MIAIYKSFSLLDRPIDQSRKLASSLGVRRQRVRSLIDGCSALAFSGGSHTSGLARCQSGEAVLFSGFISNFSDLCSHLGVKATDCASLYALGYTAWGDDVDMRIVGEYASIVSSPTSPVVRISRSPINAPSLHIWRDSERLIVAGTPRAIFAASGIQPTIDEQKLADSLYLNYAEERRSWYRDIQRLQLGERAIVSPEGATYTKYYDLRSLPRIRLKDDQSYVEAANSLLKDGVRSALAGFSRPGIMLSGGFDSQAVASHALTLRHDPIIGFTSVPEEEWDGVIPQGQMGNEGAHALALGAMYGNLEVNLVDASGLELGHGLNEVFLLGSVIPRNVMNLHWICAILDQARNRNCDVMLMGTFGNISFSFSGAGAYAGWFASGHWGRLLRELYCSGPLASLPKRFIGGALMPFVPTPISHKFDRWRRRDVIDPFDTWCPINRDYAEKMSVQKRSKEMNFDVFQRPRSSWEWRENAMSPFGELGDINSAFETIYKIKLRDPTAYRPLVEFCFGIPDEQFLRGGVNRFLARRMLQGRIPDAVLNEQRKGRQAADWHRRLARQREKLLIEIDHLSDDPQVRNVINLARMRRDVADCLAASPLDRDASYRLELAVTRGIAAARFMKYVDRRNA